MENHCKSFLSQYDLFLNNTLKFLDTSVERDYIIKLKTVNELISKFKKDDNDKNAIKKELEAVQDECSKLSYKLKTSARLFDDVQIEKEKIELEKETLELHLQQLHNILKKPADLAELSQTCYSQPKRSNQLIKNEKKTLNKTDDLLSDLSYSHSEDSSIDNVIRKSKRHFNYSTGNELETKVSEIKNVSKNGGQIIATTTLTVNTNSLHPKSVINTQSSQNIKTSLPSDSTDLSNDSEKELHENFNDSATKYGKKHKFVQKMVVIPEVCGQCFKKVKFDNYMVKCLDCETVAHLECQHLIPVTCAIDQNKVDALNCGIPPLIVHCISEIEKRGLDTVGLYRVSGSDKEVKILRDKFRKGVPNLTEVDIHVLCNCLKDCINMQKNRLITQRTLSELIDALKNNSEMSSSLRQIVSDLPSNSRNVLAYIVLHLQKVANSSNCYMDFNDLAIIFGPIIIEFSSNKLDYLHEKTEEVFDVVTELLKLPENFWLNFLKTDGLTSNELLYSTPVRNQSQKPKSSHPFFSSG